MTTWHENQLRSGGGSDSVRIVTSISTDRFALVFGEVNVFPRTRPKRFTYIKAASAKYRVNKYCHLSQHLLDFLGRELETLP